MESPNNNQIQNENASDLNDQKSIIDLHRNPSHLSDGLLRAKSFTLNFRQTSRIRPTQSPKSSKKGSKGSRATESEGNRVDTMEGQKSRQGMQANEMRHLREALKHPGIDYMDQIFIVSEK